MTKSISKRILCAVMAVLIMLGGTMLPSEMSIFSSTAEAASARTQKATITFSGMTTPGTITQGSSYTLKGVVSSTYSKITWLKAEIISGSTVKQSCTIRPKAYYVSIRSSAINTNLSFGKLSAGSYKLRYTAKAGNAIKTYTNSFTVKSKSTKTTATITFSRMAYPSTVMQGSSYSLDGTVKSTGSKITSLKCEIISGSKATQSKTIYPNSYSVSIGSSAINKDIKFGKLNTGSYTLRYTAKAGSTSKTYTRSFTVKAKVLYGDVNGDGKACTITDVVCLNNYLNGSYVSNFNKTNADVDLDGSITQNDLSIIKLVSVGTKKQSDLPIRK